MTTPVPSKGSPTAPEPTPEEYRGPEPCSLAKAVQLVGEKWTFFVLREALAGTTRFSDFRRRLGVASDVLTNRLEALVSSGILVRQDYREPGHRPRAGYHLTDAGRRLGLAVVALQDWGDVHTPSRTVSSVVIEDADGRPVHAALVDDDDRPVDLARVRFVRR